MPYVNIQITREPKASPEQKREIIRQVTETLVTVLGKDPDTTFIVIQEIETDDWGIGGVPASQWRASRAARQAAKT